MIGLHWSRYTHDVAMMDAQADRLLLTFHDGFAGGLIGTDGDQRHLPGWGFGIAFIDERKVDFFDDLQTASASKGDLFNPCSTSVRNLASRVSVMAVFGAKVCWPVSAPLATRRWPRS